jgi:hypothetical protein
METNLQNGHLAGVIAAAWIRHLVIENSACYSIIQHYQSKK